MMLAAAERGDAGEVARLLAELPERDPDEEVPSCVVEDSPEHGDSWTPLQVASLRGHTDATLLLLDALGKGHRVGGWQRSVLDVSLQMEACRGLDLAEGGVFSMCGSPLCLAALRGHAGLVRALLEARAGGAVNDGMGRSEGTALSHAACVGHTETARALLDAGAKVDSVAHGGWTVLMDAAFGGHTGVVRLLLERGANPNLVAEWHSTALSVAASVSAADVCRALVAAGADPNHTNPRTGATVLLDACGRNADEETVGVLLDAGADPNRGDTDNGPLVCALLNDRVDAAVLLVRRGAAVREDLLWLCQSAEMAEALLVRAGLPVTVAAATSSPYPAVAQWLAGSHPSQQARREMERALLEFSAGMPVDVARLVGGYVHA